ncbi:receptor-type tyrosine-protein phosphatase T-like [Polistes fuscatus]|uniref:receptor-type tyrosine-protein phosphatase T-like n=1 Tax=Polistes fuscatus TaxID=30207 RepID=UPI001CA9CF37|nr:receptor-type tyrosine-protein phosphatase T-like [Polistes fuscatus]
MKVLITIILNFQLGYAFTENSSTYNNREDSNENACWYKPLFQNTTIFTADFNFLKPGINYSIWYNLRFEQKKPIIVSSSQNITAPCDRKLNEIPFTLKVKPAIVYNVYISGNNRTILSTNILIDDRETSKVKEIQIITPSNDEVYVEWKPPERSNGKIKTYEVTLMVNEFIIIIHYNIIIIISLDFLYVCKGVNCFETILSDISTSILSSLKREHNLGHTWDKPKDCTTNSEPFMAVKLIFTGINEVVNNQTSFEQTAQSFFDVKELSLNSYEKYQIQSFPTRDHHKHYNDNTGMKLISISLLKTPTSVRTLDIYEFDDGNMTISLRWQEPLLPNGEFHYYNVSTWNQYWQSNHKHVSDNKPCKLWKNYICLKIVLTANVYTTITVTGYTKNAITVGKPFNTVYDPKTFATIPDPPKYLTIINDHKGIINLTWPHPWKTNAPIDKFLIQVQMIENNLRENHLKFERNKTYKHQIQKYKKIYKYRIILLSSTTYNISIQAVTIKNKTSEMTSSKIRTPDSITFESDQLNYMIESNTTILLKIPRLLNVTKDSQMFIVIKGKHPCKRYTKLNDYLMKSINITYNEIAWLAASFPAYQYSGKEFSVGDNQNYGEGTNCPFVSYNFYTIYVIVKGENITLLLSLKSNLFLYLTKSYVIWPIYLVVILIVIFFFVFDLRRRYNERNLRINIFPLNEIIQQTNENVQKVKPTSPILSEKSPSINRSRDKFPLLVDNIQINDSTTTTIKVKDFEDYVKNAIKLGLLDQQYESFPRGQTKSWDYGKLPQNKLKNRYANLTAYDETRVVLKKLEDDPFSDYINANYIKGYKKEKRYIATQGPKANTIVDFWRMIWQENVFVICMLTNLIENGKIKCEQYWPNIGKKKNYGDIMVFSSTHNVFADYTFRIFYVTCNDETRKIEHLHYTAWPDHGVPIYIHSVRTFLKIILTKNIENGPMVVHCSAGIGRTGTIILCDICLRRAAAEGVVNVFSEMQSIRNGRANMVDNKQQYLFVHLVLIDCLLSLSTSLPCNDALPAKIKDLKKQLEIQFRRIEDTAWQYEVLRPPVSQTSLSESNLAKNRYPELVSNRIKQVYLKRHPVHDEESYYIAAIYVDGFKEQNQYLSSQLPMPSTFGDFWRMIAEFKIELIVVLQPPDPDDPTCCPLVPGKEFNPTPYINVISKELSETNYYESNKLTLIDNSEKSTRKQPVTILTCKQWEAGKNKDPPSVITLVTLWQAAGRITRIKSPTAVLCHDGVTGCGIYLAMSFLLERMALERECDICLAIKTVRQFRPDFIRSIKDMEYLYDAALAYKEHFETYANFS